MRILEITNLIAGPTTGRILADLGADVIKLEPPAGDMSRPIGRTYFYSVNFNKRSVCIETSSGRRQEARAEDRGLGRRHGRQPAPARDRADGHHAGHQSAS